MSSTEPDLALRPATAADVGAITAVLQRSRAAAPGMPEPRRGSSGSVGDVATRVEGAEVWVAETPGGVVGFLDLDRDWLHSLYVAPEHAGAGVGSALLDLAKALRPDGFGLWVFADNLRARDFYRGHGLVELERTDGTDNEEQAPDVHVAWPGPDPVAYFRRAIDEVDDALAVLVARRLALTGAVQEAKRTEGRPVRDPEREALIARRMATRAPGPRPDTWEDLVRCLVELGLREARRGPQRSG